MKRPVGPRDGQTTVFPLSCYWEQHCQDREGDGLAGRPGFLERRKVTGWMVRKPGRARMPHWIRSSGHEAIGEETVPA